jgi:hypothetical protein
MRVKATDWAGRVAFPIPEEDFFSISKKNKWVKTEPLFDLVGII